jgi:hypothetical protein
LALRNRAEPEFAKWEAKSNITCWVPRISAAPPDTIAKPAFIWGIFSHGTPLALSISSDGSPRLLINPYAQATSNKFQAN